MLVCLITSRAIKHQPALPSPSFWNVPLFFFMPRRSTRFCSLIGRPSARRVNNAVTAGELTPVDRNNWRNLNSIPSRFNFPTIGLPFQNLPVLMGKGIRQHSSILSPSPLVHSEARSAPACPAGQTGPSSSWDWSSRDLAVR